jgi:exosome complex exonuclease DIS3/RRP44
MVHRLLDASINPNVILFDPQLLDRTRCVEVCDNLNYRHRQAQQAGRSSVELYTNLFFKGKTIVENGYVTRVLKNGFSVLVPQCVQKY